MKVHFHIVILFYLLFVLKSYKNATVFYPKLLVSAFTVVLYQYMHMYGKHMILIVVG